MIAAAAIAALMLTVMLNMERLSLVAHRLWLKLDKSSCGDAACAMPHEPFVRGESYKLTSLTPRKQSFTACFRGIYEYKDEYADDVAFLFEEGGQLIGLPGSTYNDSWVARHTGKLNLQEALDL